ncbi:MAG: helix-turn-helix domain-containing protein [Silicimonas sp.]|nr:helix-turn-helix domain-containing protein [Silicimonas sp.]
MTIFERTLEPSGDAADDLAALFHERGSTIRFAPGTTIAHQGETAGSVYRIRRGCVRSSMYSSEGERRILQFLQADDFLGLSDAALWLAAQEAVDTVVLDTLPRSVFEARLQFCPSLQRAVRHALATQVEAHASLFALTSQTTAVERVRLFLEDYQSSRTSTGFVSLPMGRRDIADHLGLSMETVSRAFSTLKAEGEIELKGANFFRLVQPRTTDGGYANAA